MDTRVVALQEHDASDGQVDAGTELKPALRRCAFAGMIAAATYGTILFLVFSAWVHYFYAGNYSGPLWISTMFGISDESVTAGARPVFEAPIAGWDGQFYYTQSNDPFMLSDYRDSRLFDSASYRFQRVGLAMIASSVATVTGQELTTPLTFHLTQLVMMSICFGLLVAWLKRNRMHWGWALVWGLYAGVLRTFAHGLPDPTADALLLITILAALSRRIWIYAVAASLLCLCRESYAAPAAAVWLLTLSGKLDWNERLPRAARVVITALPGVIVLGWAFHVAHQTDSGLLAGSRSVPFGGLVDWPFKAYFSCLWDDVLSNNRNDVIFSTVCAISIVTVFVLLIRQSRTSWFAIAMLPHMLLMTMTGSIIWEDGVGYFKNAGSVVLLGVFLLPLHRSLWLKGVLITACGAGLLYLHYVDYVHQPFLPPLMAEYTEDFTSSTPADLVPVRGSVDYSCKLELLHVNTSEENTASSGIFAPLHRSARWYCVRVTNTSETTWPASMVGNDSIVIGCLYMSGERSTGQQVMPLRETVHPGKSVDVSFAAPVPPGVAGGRFLRVGVLHVGQKWFFWESPEQKLDIPF